MPYLVDVPRYCPGTHCDDSCRRCYTETIKVPDVADLAEQLAIVQSLLTETIQTRMLNHESALEIQNKISILETLVKCALSARVKNRVGWMPKARMLLQPLYEDEDNKYIY